MLTRSKRRIPLALLTLVLALPAATPPRGAIADTDGPADSLAVDSTVTTLFLVRHAEKSLTFLGEDPPLTEAGTRRAAALAHALADAGITAIYSTHFRRCTETARPLAEHLGLKVRIDDQADFAGFARRIRSENPGGRVLVVGHSDTVPQILERLLGRPASTFPGSEHDLLYVVTAPREGRARVMRLRFGEPIPRKP